MPPRKSPTEIDGDGPRRSTRISSLQKDEKPATTTAKSKKRSEPAAGIVTEERSSNSKRVKSAKSAIDDDSAGTETKLAPIDIGDLLPDLTLKNEKDEDIQIANLASENGVVIFLVPKADTPGCTNQACGFRDIYSEFETLGYNVYCLSADAPNAQTKWQSKKELPFSLISDTHRVLISALGAGEGGKTKRSHFVFGKGGKLLGKDIPVKPVDSPSLALEFIKGL